LSATDDRFIVFPMSNQERDPGLEIAIAEAGGVRALARLVKRSSATVAAWKRIPVEHVLTIESATNIRREELRPDVYPPRRRARASTKN
jgi:DNA-binding transcriptional regulator YdaS (Cro superfamily)